MSKLDTPNEELDPVILAAMIEDPDEDEDDKKLREELLGTTETKGKASEDEDDQDDDDEDQEDEPDDKGKSKKTDDDEDEDEDDSDEDKSDKHKKRPVEAEDDKPEDQDDDEDEDDDPKLSRKEKRENRRKAFFDSILKDQPSGSKRTPNIPDYKPLDYEEAPDDGFKSDQLKQDREMHGAIQFVKGAEEARYWSEQDRFWGDLKGETRVLAYDPDLNFLSERLPNGKENKAFDPDKTSEINEMYLQLVGFKQFQRTDEQNRPLFDRATGKPILISTVDRTDISYEKFARRYVENMTNWANEKADERVDEVRNNITTQRKKQGVRPNGGSRKSLGELKPGDISRMSDEEFEKNEAEIDRQILNML